MDRMLYVAMTAAKQAFRGQTIATNNLANASTAGFRADLQATRAMPLYGPGYPTRVYAMTESPGANLTPGALETTAAPLDIAIDGDGWIAVQARDGSEAYTRAGNLRINANGLLVTQKGDLVLGNGGPITLPQYESVKIGKDGMVEIRPVGQEASSIAGVDRIKLVNPPAEDLVKGDDGLFRRRDGGIAPPDAAVTVTQGKLEGSNVNPIAEMIDIITQSRRFEMAVQAMSTAQENDELSAQRMRMNA